MQDYEILLLLKADLEENVKAEAIANLFKAITNNGGKVNSSDDKYLGVRDLAYPIKDQTKGLYIVVKATMGKEALDEFNRVAKLNTNVLRHLVIVDETK